MATFSNGDITCFENQTSDIYWCTHPNNALLVIDHTVLWYSFWWCLASSYFLKVHFWLINKSRLRPENTSWLIDEYQFSTRRLTWSRLLMSVLCLLRFRHIFSLLFSLGFTLKLRQWDMLYHDRHCSRVHI
jgi:hypothetical protein